MKNSKKTKRTLLYSGIALILCFTMLLGTTFAWFTDTASTAVNKIQAGTLDIELLDKEGNSLEGETLSWKKAAGHENEAVLWEPGASYKLQDITIKNSGNLALKYRILVTGIDGNAKLNEVIDWTVKVGDDTYDMNTEFHLPALSDTDLTISGTMQTTAGNEYQGLKITGVAITVYAAQDTVEYDSTTNQYDKDARYYTYSDSTTAINVNGKDVALKAYDIERDFNDGKSDGMAVYVRNSAELTLDDVNLTATISPDTGKRNIGFFVYNGASLVINSGEYSIDGKYGCLIWAQNGTEGTSTVVINGGTFTCNSTIGGMINAYNGTKLTINGGFFDQSAGNPNFTIQSKWNSNTTVTGGTFVNYNPSGYVPSGYHVTSATQEDGKVWYTVEAD